MKEIWKDIENYEGLYQVSNLGRIKSIRKMKKQNILKLGTRNTYNVINLMKNGKARSFQVHRLVAKAFIPNPENKPQVNHINGVKNDNRLENLEWVTRSENTIHAYRVL